MKLMPQDSRCETAEGAGKEKQKREEGAPDQNRQTAGRRENESQVPLKRTRSSRAAESGARWKSIELANRQE